jgi:hypothetical protein
VTSWARADVTARALCATAGMRFSLPSDSADVMSAGSESRQPSRLARSEISCFASPPHDGFAVESAPTSMVVGNPASELSPLDEWSD